MWSTLIKENPNIFAGKTSHEIRDKVKVLKQRWCKKWKRDQYLLPGISNNVHAITFESDVSGTNVKAIRDCTLCPIDKSSFTSFETFFLTEYNDGNYRWVRPGNVDADGWKRSLTFYRYQLRNQMLLVESSQQILSFPIVPSQIPFG